MSSYKNVIAITNRKLCSTGSNEEFLLQMKKVIDAGPKAIILREKDLSYSDYLKLAGAIIELAKGTNVNVILHGQVAAAIKLGCRKIHLPMDGLKNLEEWADFSVVGGSVHSVEEAIMAEKLGASYITCGHIFSTDCKAGLEPRGTEFLGKVVNAVNIPVYAIGGINPKNMEKCLAKGAAGVCMMSYFMKL